MNINIFLENFLYALNVSNFTIQTIKTKQVTLWTINTKLPIIIFPCYKQLSEFAINQTSWEINITFKQSTTQKKISNPSPTTIFQAKKRSQKYKRNKNWKDSSITQLQKKQDWRGKHLNMLTHTEIQRLFCLHLHSGFWYNVEWERRGWVSKLAQRPPELWDSGDRYRRWRVKANSPSSWLSWSVERER